MDEIEFRKTLSKEELEARAFMVPVKFTDFEILEQLYRTSQEMDKNFDELINIAIKRLFQDINFVNKLRR
jgi:hypothetical protein